MSSNSSPPADSDDHRQAYATALRLLARREHSVQELYHKLKGRQCPADVADEVVAALVAEGALSDRRFAEGYVQSRFERGFGPLRIRAELRERGIGEALAEQALVEYEGEWTASAWHQRHKRFGDEAPADFNQRVKQMRFLQQRGFGHEQIRTTFKNEPE